jgi:hypothetical protein
MKNPADPVRDALAKLEEVEIDIRRAALVNVDSARSRILAQAHTHILDAVSCLKEAQRREVSRDQS